MTDYLTEQCGPGARHQADQAPPPRDPSRSWRRSMPAKPSRPADPETARQHLDAMRRMLAEPGDHGSGGAV
jgi:hypothetical protein